MKNIREIYINFKANEWYINSHFERILINANYLCVEHAQLIEDENEQYKKYIHVDKRK